MSHITAEIIADIHSGEITMTREGHIWTDEEKTELYIQYYSGMGITEPAYLHQRAENAIIQQLQARGCVKYSPPIEAGASFNPPNLAKDFILRASVSKAMGFL